MALKSPLVPSPGGIMSAFSPFTDSPASPALPKSPRFSVMVHESADSLRPASAHNSPSLSCPPSELINPSPITSDRTEIEDSATEDEGPEVVHKPPGPEDTSQTEVTVRSSCGIALAQSARTSQTDILAVQAIDTSVAARPRSSSDGTPQSVIHAPEGFKGFESESEGRESESPQSGRRRKTPSPIQLSELDLEKSSQSRQESASDDLSEAPQSREPGPASPPPISTAVDRTKYSIEDATPRAQTRQEVEAVEQDRARRQRTSSLEDIPEAHDTEASTEDEMYTEDEYDVPEKGATASQSSKDEIKALKMALSECWTLCNTLAGLSSIRRERTSKFGRTGDIQDKAWKSCWKLCQKLYDSRDEDQDRNVTPTLDLCREFCQALFEARQRENDVTDSVLRVSFELNNHLYNTHDRNLPEMFRERTLAFYITLCHRLMKQRNRLTDETDSLLMACWSLAEMLFSLRQNRRDGKPHDEELLSSAVQACWELCDLFREGWKQVRPERATPRPSQAVFNSQTQSQMRQSTLSLGSIEEGHVEPETPTTIFEDMALSPDSEDVAPPPNILVLGTDNQAQSKGARWSSNASTLSDLSASSVGTSSTITTTTTTAVAASADSNLNRVKILILKAAMNSGFQRSSGQTLYAFGKSLTPTSFGHLPWQKDLLDSYKHMLLTDSAFRTPVNLPPRRISAPQMARAVEWMVRSKQYTFLVDLFRFVFGFHTEEAEVRSNVLIQT